MPSFCSYLVVNSRASCPGEITGRNFPPNSKHPLHSLPRPGQAGCQAQTSYPTCFLLSVQPPSTYPRRIWSSLLWILERVLVKMMENLKSFSPRPAEPVPRSWLAGGPCDSDLSNKRTAAQKFFTCISVRQVAKPRQGLVLKWQEFNNTRIPKNQAYLEHKHCPPP